MPWKDPEDRLANQRRLRQESHDRYVAYGRVYRLRHSLSRKMNRCGNCGEPGHYRTTCDWHTALAAYDARQSHTEAP